VDVLKVISLEKSKGGEIMKEMKLITIFFAAMTVVVLVLPPHQVSSSKHHHHGSSITNIIPGVISHTVNSTGIYSLFDNGTDTLTTPFKGLTQLQICTTAKQIMNIVLSGCSGAGMGVTTTTNILH
jgi:hypothetical protein